MDVTMDVFLQRIISASKCWVYPDADLRKAPSILSVCNERSTVEGSALQTNAAHDPSQCVSATQLVASLTLEVDMGVSFLKVHDRTWPRC